MSNHLEAIRSYLSAGLSPVPIKIKDKYPSMLREWRSYMKRPATAQEAGLWAVYKNTSEYGCGIICGAVSGNLEVIDFDNHLNNAEEIFNEYTNFEDVAAVIRRHDIPIESTPSGGYHIFYRCETIEGNQKLAKQEKTAIIETRGEGGLIVTAPTRGYTLLAGNLCEIPVISSEERDTLLSFARAFNQVEVVPEPVHTSSAPTPESEVRPGDFYNDNCAGDVPAILTAAGWQHLGGKYWRRPGKKTGVSATFGHVAPNTFYCFTSNGHPFEENRTYKPFSVFAMLEHGGDFSAAARTLVARYPFDLGGHKPPVTTSAPVTPPANVQQVVERGIFNIKTQEIIHDTQPIDFYAISDKGAIKILWSNLRRFLTRHGFFRYRSGEKYAFVRVLENVADFVSLEDIQNYILRFLLNNDLEEAHDKIWDTDKLNDKKLQMLDECEPVFVRDPEDYSYVFFRNTAVYVSKYEKKTVPYKDLPGFVWKRQIIDRDYNDLKEDVIDNCDFAEFCKRISAEKIDRMGALMGALGYLMHTYKDPAFPPVINFTDESNDDGPAGGSGKGIIFQAVARIRNVVFVDGKNFDPKHPFALQRVSEDTDIIFFQDLDKKFDFEAFFSMVTDGMVIQKKYQGERFISYKETPKIGLNANYQIKGNSESFTRRLFDIEVHKYFNQQRTILEEYGHRFFEDGWDSAEWNKFDNFMMYCIQYYLRNGLQKPEYVYVGLNKLKANTNDDFAAWAATSIMPNKRYNKATLYERYREESGDDVTKQKYFTRYLKIYAEFKGWEVSDRVGNAGKEIEFISQNEPAQEPADMLPF